jgi:hypothetical protein
MRFHLNHTPEPSGFKIGHADKIFLVGSCFAESIGRNLQEHRFTNYINPNGIVFNPISISESISATIQTQPFDERFLVKRNGVYLSFLHHSSFHDVDQQNLLEKINSENKKANKFLREASYLMITFGSAFVYHHNELDAVVTNCHKQAADLFTKYLLPVEQIVEPYSVLIKTLQDFNPDLKIIFTVSPVKYLKDGLLENNLSKATLLLSVAALSKQFHNCFYFPAYELVNDDLRDYRFYKKDMAHPNEQAIEYVWEKFSACFFNEQTQELNKQIQKLILALNHKRMIEDNAETLKLIAFIDNQMDQIKKLYPNIQL